MILDTSFVIDVLENKEEAVERLKQAENSSKPIKISSPTTFELWSGLQRSNNKQSEKQSILEIVSSMNKAELDDNAAKKGGELDAKLISQGKRIQPQDCMIAGIAITKSEKLLTCDNDFNKISEISNLNAEIL